MYPSTATEVLSYIERVGAVREEGVTLAPHGSDESGYCGFESLHEL